MNEENLNGTKNLINEENNIIIEIKNEEVLESFQKEKNIYENKELSFEIGIFYIKNKNRYEL
jgi:hypothetical protein